MLTFQLNVAMKSLLSSLFLFLAIHFMVFAQSGTIKGTVKDAETGETLPFCNVFINNTTIKTATDIEGNFILENLEPGPLEVSFSFLGYQAETKKVTLNPGGSLTVNLSMEPFVSELSDVEIKASRDKAWERELRKFTNLFLGNDEVASLSEIENPWVIDFPEEEEKGTFLASANQSIEITNNYLGYQIGFDLNEFFQSRTNYKIAGAARFSEMTPTSESQSATWEQNRATVYQKSAMNLFRSIIMGEQEKEGFYLYGDKPGGSPSMNMRTDIFANELGKSVIPYKPDKLFEPADTPGQYLIYLKGRIEIHYQKGYSQVNTYIDAPYPVSWLEVNGGVVRVKENGTILNPEDLVFSGDMDRKRISTLLPLDYDAERAIQLSNLKKTAANYQEKIYLHTDKPFYFAGDEVFFKAYLNYGNPYLRNELSKVLHVQLIDEDRKYVLQKKFTIQNGLSVGSFYLSDSLSGEKYYLRAYTQWARNYGPDHFYTSPIRVLTPYQRVVPNRENSIPEPERVKLTSEKASFGPKELVKITIKTQDIKGMPVPATLSVSILDQSQIPFITESQTIASSLNLEEISESVGLDRFSYPIEKSLSENWKMLDQKGKPTAGEILVFVNDFEGMVELQADRQGDFAMEEMEFYGKMKLAMQGTDNKGKAVSDIEYQEKLSPPFALPADASFPEVETVSEPIRVKEEEAIEELEVVVIEESAIEESNSLYGKPSYIVSGEKLITSGNTTDLVNSLAGNIPGMRVTLEGASGRQQIRIRGGAISVGGSMEPLVMLNGNIMVTSPGSTAADNIKSINPFDIDRVEIVARTVSMMGDQGRNGVIAIYLKSFDPTVGGENAATKASGFKEFEIEGYAPTNPFFQIDYSQEKDLELKDQRQTLYWNPYLVTDERGSLDLSFYTNEIAGPMLVEVRGFGLDGKAISGTFLINVK